MFEQNMVWPKFQAAVSREELEKLGEKLEAAKKIAPTRPHADTPPNSAVQKTMGSVAAMADHVRDVVSGREADSPPTRRPSEAIKKGRCPRGAGLSQAPNQLVGVRCSCV